MESVVADRVEAVSRDRLVRGVRLEVEHGGGAREREREQRRGAVSWSQPEQEPRQDKVEQAEGAVEGELPS